MGEVTTKGAGLIFSALLKEHHVQEPIREFKFHPQRKWRADFCWPDERLILEVDGGLFIPGGGRHNRGAAMLADFEKLNAAAVLGYRVLRCVPKQLLTMETVDMVRRALAT